MPKTILITGANGFIGSHIYQALLHAAYNVIAITRSASPKLAKNDDKIWYGNFYDTALLNTIQQPIDTIIHCAAIRGESDIPESEYHTVNVAGTETLLRFAKERHIPNFIYLSSVGVLGTIPAPQPASNTAVPKPDGKYHQSKWQAEKLVKKHHSEQLKTIIIRPTITYGPGDDGFIPKMVELIKDRRFVFPKRDIHIHILSVAGLAELILKVTNRGLLDGKIYIAADKEPVRLKTLVDLIANKVQSVSLPGRYQIPVFTFSLIKLLLKILNKKQLRTSIQLISEDWTYDLEETISKLGYSPKDTLEEVNRLFR